MRIVVRGGLTPPDHMPYDVAERKGLGHPDSLADLVADAFSRAYATSCLQSYGIVPNHWVDKVTLVGASARVDYGSFEIDKPVDCYLFGKITDTIGPHSIDVASIFRHVVVEVFTRALGGDDIVPYTCTHVNNTRGSAVDHDREFYTPWSTRALRGVLERESVVNDTVVCVGASERGRAGRTAIWLENTINSPAFRTRFPAVGSDVKVMVVRVDNDFDVTAAIPIHPQAASCWRDYTDCIAEIDAYIAGELKAYLDRAGDVRLRVNTKDSPGRGYLAPFGTSLGKGDCGTVGRGNRPGGVIEPLRPAGCEAPAGKNPLHHGGKIYTALADVAARRIHAATGVFAEVTIVARNGDALDDPAFVLARLHDQVDVRVRDTAERIITDTIASAADYHRGFFGLDPVTAFRGDSDGR